MLSVQMYEADDSASEKHGSFEESGGVVLIAEDNPMTN